MSFFTPIENPDDLLRISLPDTKSRMGWEFDYNAMIAAHKTLGLRYPVHIRFTAGDSTRGAHRPRKTHDGYVHRISISQDKTKEGANNTLWHELRHAMQSENTGALITDFYEGFYKHARGAWGASYQENDYEIDARKFAVGNEHIKLIREV